MSDPDGFSAAVLVKLREPLQIVDGIKVPDLQPHQVLVRIFYAGLCHSQVMEARGHRGDDPYLPHMLGHEGTGEVVRVGSDVTKVAGGDHVILTWIKGAGGEAGGCKYHGPTGQEINSGGVTTFGEYAVVSENRLVKKPDGIPFDLGVLLGCALPTGTGIILNEIQPEPGASIAVVGLGGIGISAFLAAATREPKTLIAIDVEEEKLALARELGATHTFNAKLPDLISKVKDITGGMGVDYAVEASGLASMIENAFEMVRRNGGELVFASHPKAGDLIKLDPFELICGKKIRGSWGGGTNPDRDFEVLAELYRSGKLPLERLLSDSYELDDINDALNDLEARKIMRALIKIKEPPNDGE